MKLNIINYLGLLGFLGLLGLITGNFGFFGFFGFFGLLSTLGGKGSDERIDRNINRACRNAYAVITVAMSFTLIYVVSFNAIQTFPVAFAFLFIISIVTFVASFAIYDRRGD